VAGALVVVSAPFMGEIRRWIRLQFPGHFVAIVGGAVGIAAAGAIGWALMRVRERRLWRYGFVVAAVALAVVYSRWSALGNAESDVVERVHFVEYGVLAWLFYRAWRPLGDATVLPLTFLSATTVGTFEEWFQWFIPARVGEVRDVLLNAAAIACGILISLAVRPLDHFARSSQKALAHLAFTTAIAVAALAGFVDSAHIGHEIRDPEAGTFRSIYESGRLLALAEHRNAEWATNPPRVRPRPVSREDQYASEGLLHVQARNNAWSAGDVRSAWFENRILEKYFAPVLDAPSYVSATGHRWAPEHRAQAEQRLRAAAMDGAGFVSRAEGEFPILLWNRTGFRFAALAAITLLLGLWVAARRS
jgi:VanZ family protein